MEKTVKIGILFDWYGALLSERQREAIGMYYIDDLSLTEIAAEMEISKQAVSEQLNRAESNLLEYESKLQLYAHQERQLHLLEGLALRLEGVAQKVDVSLSKEIQSCLKTVSKLTRSISNESHE